MLSQEIKILIFSLSDEVSLSLLNVLNKDSFSLSLKKFVSRHFERYLCLFSWTSNTFNIENNAK